MNRPLFVGLVPLLLSLNLGCQRPSETSVSPPTAISRAALSETVDITGELVARSSASIGPPVVDELWEFKISMLAPEGADIAEGDSAVAFDTSQLHERLARATANRDAAETSLEKTVTDLEIEARELRLRLAEAEARKRKAQLKVEIPEGVVARNELAQYRIDLDLANAEVAYLTTSLVQLNRRSSAELKALGIIARRARSQVTALEASIGRMTVVAPRSGTVLYKQNWRGEKKKIGDGCWRNETVIEIPDLTTLMATAEVDEAEAARLRVGQSVEFQLDALRGKTFKARVKRVGRAVQEKSWRDKRRVIKLDLELEQRDLERMRPGMRFVGELEIGSDPLEERATESGPTRITSGAKAAR